MKMITLYVNLGDVEKTLWSRGVFRLTFEQTSDVLLRHCEAQNRLIIMWQWWWFVMMMTMRRRRMMIIIKYGGAAMISWSPNLSHRSTAFFSVLNSLPSRDHLDDSDDTDEDEDETNVKIWYFLPQNFLIKMCLITLCAEDFSSVTDEIGAFAFVFLLIWWDTDKISGWAFMNIVSYAVSSFSNKWNGHWDKWWWWPVDQK